MLNLDELTEKYPLPFKLKPEQAEDIAAANHFQHVLLDLPVGYGKTVICTYTALGREADRILVAIPPILTKQWSKWVAAIPNTGSYLEYKGTPAVRRKLDLQAVKWVFTSYGLFRNDFETLKSWLLKGSNPALIVDEAQNLKNSSSVLYKYTKQLALGADVILSSGTLMSKPDDGYSYVKIKNPDVYRSKGHFDRVHIAEVDFFGQPTKYQNLDFLQKNLRLNCVHREKAVVQAHLKSRTYTLEYDLHPDHLKLYHQLMEEQLILLPNDGKIDATTAQKLYTISQQLVVNWGFFSGNPDNKSASFDLIDTVCDEVGVSNIANSKLIIWTWYKRTTASVFEHLKRYGAVAAYSGSDSQKAVDAFMEDKHTRILVAQPGSAGAGLNPQYVCSEALFIETPTRTIPFVQSAGRIDREGQKFVANNRIGIASGTIQNMLHENLLANDALVSKAAGSVRSLRDVVYGSKG